jgi:hypothetical protein
MAFDMKKLILFLLIFPMASQANDAGDLAKRVNLLASTMQTYYQFAAQASGPLLGCYYIGAAQPSLLRLSEAAMKERDSFNELAIKNRELCSTYKDSRTIQQSAESLVVSVDQFIAELRPSLPPGRLDQPLRTPELFRKHIQGELAVATMAFGEASRPTAPNEYSFTCFQLGAGVFQLANIASEMGGDRDAAVAVFHSDFATIQQSLQQFSKPAGDLCASGPSADTAAQWRERAKQITATAKALQNKILLY